MNRYQQLARDGGLIEAVTALHADLCPGVLPCGPTGYALVPLEVEAACVRAQVGPVRLDRRHCQEAVVRIVPLGEDVLLALRCVPDGEAAGEGVPQTGDWQAGLAWLRLGSSQRLLTACTRYLTLRTTGGQPILHQQMVKGMTADALVEQLAAQTTLEALPDDSIGSEAVAEAQRQITAANAITMRMFGATGFCEDGPGAEAYCSDLLADVYRTGPR